VDASIGTLFVISAPSGTGKSTVVGRLLRELPGLVFSVSYTTRPARDEERDGEHYHFIDEARFDAMIEEDGFLEWAAVHGHRYGTGVAATEQSLASGNDLMLDIDVQGTRKLRQALAKRTTLRAVFVMALPPNYATLENRLRGRGSEGARQVERRLAKARVEALEYPNFDYVVVNDDLDRAVLALRTIVLAERLSSFHRRAEIEAILATFPA